MKAWKITISGSYTTANKEVMDYAKVTGFIPYVEEDIALQCARRRYAPMWISQDPKYKERVNRVREMYLDSMEVVDHDFSFLGKDIKEMDDVEIQDLATFKDLKAVPLWRTGSLRQAQMVAYVEYTNKVAKGSELDWRSEGFNLKYGKLPPMIVEGNAQRSPTKKLTNDEVIEAEQASVANPKDTLTLEELKKMADEKGIKYHPNSGRETLYKKVFGEV